ncbi:MAG: hypothetical protein APF80_04405 [Alphaproteobacteria bacterium BRH_c36]|nr:MAG: hypothetical protein APF80_04405 [Alphaproteobacteria bacterium BRH_c36]
MIGIAFGFVGAVIGFRGFFCVSDRALVVLRGGNRVHDVSAMKVLCAQRYDLRWAALLIAVGFGMELISSIFPNATSDPRLFLSLLIALSTYVYLRGATIRHDVAAVQDNLGDVAPLSNPAVAQLARAAA